MDPANRYIRYYVYNMVATLRLRKRTAIYVVVGFLLVAGYAFMDDETALNVIPTTRAMIAYDDMKCGCTRLYPSGVYQESLCSTGASRRGPGQKVVAYTVYGTFGDDHDYRKYWGQIEDRIKEVYKYYPGWTMRLYHNVSSAQSVPYRHLCTLYCQYHHFDTCFTPDIYPISKFDSLTKRNIDEIVEDSKTDENESMTKDVSQTVGNSELENIAEDVAKFISTSSHIKSMIKNTPSQKKRTSLRSQSDAIDMIKSLLVPTVDPKTPKPYSDRLIPKMWRFIPMTDPSVAEFLVRDVDSTILPREVAAVSQWLNESTAILHVMRDHPSHNGVILAGMWGGSRERGAKRLADLFKKMIRWPPRNLWDYDQRLLQRVVWPEIKDSVVIHDSYFCRTKVFLADHRSLPFPTQRQGTDFVSWGILRDEERSGIIKCPIACRPVQHRDWKYC